MHLKSANADSVAMRPPSTLGTMASPPPPLPRSPLLVIEHLLHSLARARTRSWCRCPRHPSVDVDSKGDPPTSTMDFKVVEASPPSHIHTKLFDYMTQTHSSSLPVLLLYGNRTTIHSIASRFLWQQEDWNCATRHEVLTHLTKTKWTTNVKIRGTCCCDVISHHIHKPSYYKFSFVFFYECCYYFCFFYFRGIII